MTSDRRSLPRTGAIAARRPAAGHDHAGGPRTRADRRRIARERLIALATLMDGAFAVPGVRGGVGLDALLGLVPVVGDALSALIGLYAVSLARELGASRTLQARMVGNLMLDAAIGVVPVAGDLADIYFRAHKRNLRLLQKHLGEPWIEGEARVHPGR